MLIKSTLLITFFIFSCSSFKPNLQVIDIDKSINKDVNLSFDSDSTYQLFIKDFNSLIHKYNNTISLDTVPLSKKMILLPINLNTVVYSSKISNQDKVNKEDNRLIVPNYSIKDYVLDFVFIITKNKHNLIVLTKDSIINYKIEDANTKIDWVYHFDSSSTKSKIRDVFGKIIVKNENLFVYNSFFNKVYKIDIKNAVLINDDIKLQDFFDISEFNDIRIENNLFYSNNSTKLFFYDAYLDNDFLISVNEKDHLKVSSKRLNKVFISKKRYGSQLNCNNNFIAITAAVIDNLDFINIFSTKDPSKLLFKSKVQNGIITSLKIIQENKNNLVLYMIYKDSTSILSSFKFSGEQE